MKGAFDAMRRVIVLQALEQDRDHEMSVQMIQAALDYVGQDMGSVAVGSLIDWLRDADLVSVRAVDDVRLVRLTERGKDVAQGRASASGVARPIDL